MAIKKEKQEKMLITTVFYFTKNMFTAFQLAEKAFNFVKSKVFV